MFNRACGNVSSCFDQIVNFFCLFIIIALVLIVVFSAFTLVASAQTVDNIWWKICDTNYGCLLKVDHTWIVNDVPYESGYPAAHPVSVTELDGTWAWVCGTP